MKVSDTLYRFIKRGMDLVLATGSLVLISPVFLLLMLVLSLTGEHKVFYRQTRVGLGYKPFPILKFATMISNSSQLGTGDIVVQDDFRVTKVGRFLRRTKLNELPQLINVISGDMSLVGPRPLMPESFRNYSPEVQSAISRIKPGITGIGSIIFRNEEQMVSDSGMNPRDYYNQYIYPYKGALEMWYQRHASVFIDMHILLMTGWVIIFPKSKVLHKVFAGLPEGYAQFA